MKVNVDLDEKLVEEAFRHAKVSTEQDLIKLALEAFVRSHSRKDMRELRGKIAFAPEYDPKKMRQDAESDG